MKIIPNADQPTAAGPADSFAGDVHIDQRFSAPAPASLGAAIVTFAPGARTAWHTHPLGQMLYILSGMGWVQRDGGPKITIAAGDTVWFEPGERHWHGASATKAMCHVAVAQAVDGRSVDWLEQVTDADYLA